MSQRRINGPAVRAIREALGISLNKFAEDVGMDNAYLSRLERGHKQNARDSTIALMARRLGVAVDAVTIPLDSVIVTVNRSDVAAGNRSNDAA